MKRIRVILEKEWIELRQNRTLVASLVFLPLLFTALPVIATFIMGHIAESELTRVTNVEQFRGLLTIDPLLAGMSMVELSQAVIGKQMAIIFLINPILIPGSIASYSIVGEKTRRTLEPLLATPIRTWELMLAKSLAAFIPTIVVTFSFGIVMMLGTSLSAVSARVTAAIFTPAWLLLFIAGTPLLGLITITLTVMVSSRTNDPRTAQQVSGVLILPLVALIFGQITGLVVLGVGVILAVIAVLGIIAALMVYLASRVFEREAILTRWT